MEHDEVRRHLEKILASSAFSNARRAQQFLRFVVEESLAGRASDIKETVVAAQVFNLSGKFDRRNNSIVRAEATHVRRRLRDYYLAWGSSDTIVIDLPRGRYLPVIRAAPPDPRRKQLAAILSWFRLGQSSPRE